MSNVARMIDASWSRDVAGWVSHMGAAGLSSGTIQIRVYHLQRVAAGVKMSPRRLTVDVLAAWLYAQGWSSANTRRAYRGSLRSFYSWMLASGRVTVSPAHQLPAVRVPRSRPRPCPEEAYRFALQIGDKRARLAVLLAGGIGLRRAEVAAARREDLEPDLIGWSLRVVGKGGHVRLIPVSRDIAARIRACPAGYLFPSPKGGHLTPHHLGKIVSRHLPEGYTMHSLRHRFGTASLRAPGSNLRVVQELLGHAHLNTTAIYTLVDDDDMRAVVEAVA